MGAPTPVPMGKVFLKKINEQYKFGLIWKKHSFNVEDTWQLINIKKYKRSKNVKHIGIQNRMNGIKHSSHIDKQGQAISIQDD